MWWWLRGSTNTKSTNRTNWPWRYSSKKITFCRQSATNTISATTPAKATTSSTSFSQVQLFGSGKTALKNTYGTCSMLKIYWSAQHTTAQGNWGSYPSTRSREKYISPPQIWFLQSPHFATLPKKEIKWLTKAQRIWLWQTLSSDFITAMLKYFPLTKIKQWLSSI